MISTEKSVNANMFWPSCWHCPFNA